MIENTDTTHIPTMLKRFHAQTPKANLRGEADTTSAFKPKSRLPKNATISIKVGPISSWTEVNHLSI